MKDNKIKDTFKICILISLFIILMTIFIIFISNNNNCYLEKYEEYPCQGATHYARVHRNRNEPCERYKRICERKCRKSKGVKYESRRLCKNKKW